MVTLNLTPEEQAILVRSLSEYLSELKMEISNTENWEYKEGLKKEEGILDRVIAALAPAKKGKK